MAAKRAKWAGQTIDIGDDLRIIKIDEYNWQIQRLNNKAEWKPWPQENYYGMLQNALECLPATLLGWEAKNSLADIRRCITGIREDIRIGMEAP